MRIPVVRLFPPEVELSEARVGEGGALLPRRLDCLFGRQCHKQGPPVAFEGHRRLADTEGAHLVEKCADAFVAWGNGSGNGDPGQYVVDVPSGKLWKLGASPGISAVRAAGTMLAWTLPPKAQEAAPIRVTKWHRP